ncbi:MAG: PAS domain S-box protein, partial [Candidatus Omnitrophota bacterium]
MFAVERDRFDFIVCNPALYVQLEVLFGATRIATLRNSNPEIYSTRSGSVFISRAVRRDIISAGDMKQKKLMAVDPLAFTGWVIACGEFKKYGLSCDKSFKSVVFAGSHDAVVYGILNNEADVGIVGTGILEKMAKENLINLDDIRVINQQGNVPFRCSSVLYPDWVFARGKNVPAGITSKVAIALLSMPADSDAARAAGNSGWAVPQNYQSVRELLMELRMDPYSTNNYVSVLSLQHQRFWLIIIIFVFFVLLVGSVVLILFLNRKISAARTQASKMFVYQQSLIDNFPALIWRSDVTGKCDYFNKAWLKFTGRTLEEEQGDGWAEGVHPDDRRECLHIYTDAFASKTAFESEYRLRRFDGQYRWIIDHGRPNYGVDGKFTGYLGSCYDITERKQVNESLQDNLSWLQLLIDTIPNPIFFKDAKGLYTGCNRAFLEFTGLRRAEVVGHTVYEIFSPELADIYFRSDIELLSRGGRQQYEAKVKYADGVLHDVIFNRAVFNQPDGSVGGIVGVIIDITERKAMEEELKRTIRSTRDIIEQAPFGMYVINRSGAVEYVNAAMLDISGDSREQFMSLKMLELQSYIDFGLSAKIKRVFEGEYFRLDGIEYTSVNSGKTTTRNFIGIPLQQGAVYNALIIVEDVTQRKKADEKLRDAVVTKSKFLSMVSHELRTPLTAIKEGINIVLEGLAGDLNAEQKDFLETARRNVDRLARLINDVLDFQKLESGKMQFSFQEHDINDVVREIARAMDAVVKAKGLALNVKCDDSLRKIQFDRDKIVQVLTNLVNNAMKFTPQGSITLMTQATGATVTVTVQDTGPGIKPEDLPKLFQSFQQLGDEKVRKGGSGLGLVISKEIVEHHQGRIWVESKVGEGTRFMFALPKHDIEDILSEIVERTALTLKEGQVFDLYCMRVDNFEQIIKDRGNEQAQSMMKRIVESLEKAVGHKEFISKRGSGEIVVFAEANRDHLADIRKRIRDAVKEAIFDSRQDIK